jgi:GrpB-like predicted nucleotidyltransferase (UPF0157 family)
VLVRVPQSEFAHAVPVLRNAYSVHQPHNWTPTLASFTDPASSAPPVGVQLVVAGSASDELFGPFRDALIGDPALLAEYNALKLRLDASATSGTPPRKARSSRMCCRGSIPPECALQARRGAGRPRRCCLSRKRPTLALAHR